MQPRGVKRRGDGRAELNWRLGGGGEVSQWGLTVIGNY